MPHPIFTPAGELVLIPLLEPRGEPKSYFSRNRGGGRANLGAGLLSLPLED